MVMEISLMKSLSRAKSSSKSSSLFACSRTDRLLVAAVLVDSSEVVAFGNC